MGAGEAAPSSCLSTLWIKCSPTFLKLGAWSVSFLEKTCICRANAEKQYWRQSGRKGCNKLFKIKKQNKIKQNKAKQSKRKQQQPQQIASSCTPKTQRTTVGFFVWPSEEEAEAILVWSAGQCPVLSMNEVVSSDDWRCPIVKAQMPQCYYSIFFSTTDYMHK